MNEPQQMTEQTVEPDIPGWGMWMRDALHPAIAPSVILIVGAAVYAFNRQKHVFDDFAKDEHREVWVSLDFNVHPMAATLWNPGGPKSKFTLSAFDEIKINSSNTWEMAETLKERLKDDYVVIFPDPMGASRSTKTRNVSDIDILKQYGFKDIRYRSKAPPVRDALNACNALFAKGKIRVHKRCKELIADFEQCVIKAGTFEIDKSNPKRTHWLDGAKYMIHYEFPIRRPKVQDYREVRIR